MSATDEALLRERVRELEAENAGLKERLHRYETVLAVDVSRPDPTSPDYVARAFSQAANQASPARYAKVWKDYDEDVPTFPDRPHFEKLGAVRHPSTQVVVFDGCPNDPYHPSSMPIYQTATFVQPNINEFGPYDYTRSGNPTRTALEVLVAKLEGSHASFAFTSGMAALGTLVMTLSTGDEILASSDLYGGMHRLITQVTERVGIKASFVDMSNLASLEEALKKGAGNIKLVHLESPTNPLMKICDIAAVASLAHKYDSLMSIDCTMMTPVRCQPLALGADVVIHSGTKFFCGHSDTMSGFVSVRDPDLAKRVAFLQNAQGSALAPFDSWLLLRGMKTMALRVERQETNAIACALLLARANNFVTKLHYTGIRPDAHQTISSLSMHDYELHHKQTTGPGSVLSFETGSVERSRKFVDACKLFKLTVSFGSCNSLVEMPCVLSHASIPAHKRTLPEDLIRLSVGIEHVQDLIFDLDQAIEAAMTAYP